MQTARSSDGIVMLDISGDGYFCVYDPVGPAEAGKAAPAGCPSEPRPTTVSSGTQPATAPEWQDARVVADPGMTLDDICHFILALGIAAVRFRRYSFSALLTHAATKAPPIAPLDPPATAILIARFDRLCLWLPFQIQCLFRSFLLLHFLRRYGIAADWVFGAALFPFRAHCWLANRHTVLGDRAHRISAYSILYVAEAAAR